MFPCAQCGTSVANDSSRSTDHVWWHRTDSLCPACVQHSLLHTLLERGEPAFHLSIQSVWPVDAEAAFGALPTPLRLHADPRFSGKGTTIALLDSGFYPHPDLVEPRNRIRAWIDAGQTPLEVRRFTPEQKPMWPGWDSGSDGQWHGTMTSVAAAGNGYLSHGLYSGLASQAEVVLIQVRDEEGHISSESLCRGLQWLRENAAELQVRVVSMSCSGDAADDLRGNPVDEAVAGLVQRGICVVAAAGNDGVRQLIPPATAPHALTVGGIDDHNEYTRDEIELWHSNYGEASSGGSKPDLVAPSLWIAAPILPGTRAQREAQELFDRRRAGDRNVQQEMLNRKLITPYYQHVDGTSFAAPLVASAVCCLLEANPMLTPHLVREILQQTAHEVPDVSRERQGAGALDAGRAVARALAEQHSQDLKLGPEIQGSAVIFTVHDHGAKHVAIRGSWNGWQAPGLIAGRVEGGVWRTRELVLPSGRYEYRLVFDEQRWLDDPANLKKIHNGLGGWNSVFEV